MTTPLTTAPDLKALSKLRLLFLNPSAEGVSDYWSDPDVLAAYHKVLGERIRWKWQGVLSAIGLRDQARESLLNRFNTVVDWGCGTGVASQALATWLSTQEQENALNNWVLSDRSPLAMDFASQKLQDYQVSHLVAVSKSAPQKCPSGPKVLGLISHVLTELTESSRQELLKWASSCGGVLWIEPGTPHCSSLLVSLREQFRGQGFVPLAPCPHINICPFVDKKHNLEGQVEALDWCHFHAKPPNEAFQTAFWAKVSKDLKLDLRDLSVGYLFMVKDQLTSSSSVGSTFNHSTHEVNGNAEVLLGRLHHSKVNADALLCSAKGLQKKKFSKKKDRALIKKIEKHDPGEFFD